MKTMMAILTLICSTILLAQDKSAFPTVAFYADSLASTRDTVDVSLRSDLGFDFYQITTYSTNADTLTVWVQSDDAARFVQRGVVNLATGATAATIITSSTAVDFAILGGTGKVRFMSPALPNTIYFTISGKKGVLTK